MEPGGKKGLEMRPRYHMLKAHRYGKKLGLPGPYSRTRPCPAFGLSRGHPIAKHVLQVEGITSFLAPCPATVIVVVPEKEAGSHIFAFQQ